MFFVGANLLDTLSGSVLASCKGSAEAAAISDDFWCGKCRKFFDQCVEVAATVGVVVVDGLFKPKITLKCCKREHTF